MLEPVDGPRPASRGSHRAPREARSIPRLLTAGVIAAVTTSAVLLVASQWPTLTATPVGADVSAGALAQERTGASRSRARAGTEAVSTAAAARAGVSFPAYRLAPRAAPLRRVPGTTAAGEPKKVVPGLVLLKAPVEPEPVPSAAFSYQVGTFNVLGSQHTRGSSRYASGTTRAGFVADLVTSRGVDVIGLQEVQDDQLAVLRRRLSGYGNWPGQALGGNGNRLQLFWDAGQFEMVDAYSFDTTFDHQRRPIPVVRLRHLASGSESWHMVVHNSPREQEADRDAATGTEIAQVGSLRASGLPVFVVGDMNEKEEWFCRVGGATGLQAANGGSTAGGCALPPRPLRIDWLMGAGGEQASMTWSGYVRDTSSLVQRTSDHDFLYATATITPLVAPPS